MAISTDQFRDHLIASGLLTVEDVSSMLASLPADKQPQDGEQLARELVRQKKLTKYQAEQIYLGKGKSLVLGNYTILDKLGQGGMGMVLKAEHKRLKRLVALKVLSPAALKTPDALKRFHREVEAAAKLRHTNVVATDDADEAKGTHFLVMEYVEGSDLSALVKKKGPLSVGQALQCILQAARGLEYAHEQGVVHRDIKPANLLLDSKGTVKILDMGLARIEGDSGGQAELTSTGAVMGTVDYMAPEQALSTKTADARSDIYSLGISLWYLLTGKCAYDGDTLMAKLLAHRDAPIPSLTAVRNEVSASIDAVFQKMVAKQSKDRYQSMTEVIRDLEACQSGASFISSLSASAVDDDANPLSLLNNLSGPATSVTNTRQAQPTTTRQVQPTATYVAADPAAEATMLTGDMAQATDPQTMTSARASSSPKKWSRSKAVASLPWWQDRRVQIGGGAAAVLLLLAVVFLFQTPNGTLRVEILDPEVEMRVKGTELTFQGSDLEPVSLKAGEKKLLVTRGDLSFETEAFTLKKGTETRVKVELQGDKLVVNGGGKVIAEQPIQRKGLTTSTTGSDPAFSQWLKDVQAMPAEKQLEAVSKKLVELNPGFDGKLFHHVDGGQGQGVPKIEKGLVTELHFYTDKVTDLSPVRAFSGLKTLSAFPANFASELTDLSPLQGMQLTDLLLAYNSKLSDISPLKGMRLTKLGVRGCAVTDLAPLKGMRLATLDCDGMKTTDLSPLQGMPLQTLDINHTLATDFTPLKGMPLDALYASFTKMGDLSVLHKMPLTTLEISGCPNISDLSPLKELPLKHLGVDFKPDRNADILRSIKTLESINGKSAAEFWKEVEEQQKGKPGITPDGPAPPPAIAPFDAAQAKAHQEAWARYLGVPVEFTNSLGMKFKLIPPGEFAMGFDPALKAELERLKMLEYDAERNKKTRYDHLDAATPRHLVTIPQPYYIGVEEVRVGWYRDVMGSLPPDNPADKPDESVTRNVGQREAIEFCNRLSEREKRPPSFVVTGHTTKLVAEAGGYRLPTEAEWEFACRAGTDTFYFFGNDRGEKGTTGASILSQYQRGRSGAQTRSNPFGLFDVYGGSNEWCWGPVVLSKTNSLCPEPYAASSTMKIDIPAAVDKGAFGVSRGGATSEGAGVDARTVNSYSRRAANRLTVDKWGGVGRLVLPILAPRSVKPTAVQPAPNTAPAAVAPPFAKSPFDVAQAKAHQAAWAKHLGTEVVKPNSIGMQMTLIPPGEFLMGSTDEQVEETLRLNAKAFQTIRDKIQKAERPQHRVIITKPFLIGTTEVTVGQFKQFVAATNYVTEAEKFGFGDSSDNVMSSGISDAQKQRNWRNLNYSYPVTDDFPVSQITWNDAVAFCQWLSEHEKATYRLPTEAEWEYACRAGTTTQFFFGDDEKQLTNYGNVGTSRLTAVSAKSPNPFGLYDTLGNVMEWCSDFHSDDWYSKSPAIDPAGPSSGTHRAIRGGGMAWGSPKCRSATRDGYIPTHRTAPVGFRVVGEVREGIATVKTVTPAERPTVGSQPAPAVAPFDAKQARAHQEVWAKHLGTQIETTNSVGQKMILIPPGEFLMGSSDADIALALKIAEETELDKGGVNRLQEERPQHRVRITKPFRLAAYEVTIGQFAKFIEQAKYKTQAEEFGGNSAAITSEDVKPYSLKLNWRAPGEAVTDDSPVTQVSWNDAVAFCNWLSGQEQLTPCYQRDGDTWTLQPKANGYRLPTEAEWEYSCRAGTATQFSFGDDWKELDKYGWSNKNSGGRPHSVGLLPANAFGLHDMHGNVWEWCHDWYDGKWYEKSPSDDPLGPSRASYRVGRGGSWYGLPAGSRRSSSRGNHRSTPSDRHGDRGFRPVLGSVGAQSGTTSVTASSQPVPSNSSSDRNTPKFTNTLGM